MENYFDLDEFSKKEENSEYSEELKSNSPQRNSDIDSSSNNEFSPFYSSSSDKEQKSPGQLIISKNHNISGISNNPINISSFNNYKSENLKICEQNLILEIDKDYFQDNKKNNNYAEEDNIDISKFDEIKEPAMKFKFKLDIFQKRSIIRLEENKNILVCAHTSSGKTLVAEYGIALGKKNKKKVIYTSPIKALSTINL